YKPKGGERKRETCGRYPAVTLAAARQRAKEIDAAAARGVDLPALEERQREEQRKAEKRLRTVGDLIDEYVERDCKVNHRRWQEVARVYDLHVRPALGKKALIELRRADVVELLDVLQNEKGFKAQVNRVRSLTIAALNWAVEREHLDSNPAAAVKKRKI